MAILQISTKRRAISIIALNAVSTFSQIGQYGLGSMLVPIAMVAKGASPEQIGLTSAAFWLGMLLGLLLARQLTQSLGYRLTVIIGLIVSAFSFTLMPLIDWHWWLIPAALVGFGLGLRWIANETWLYLLAPADARGRIIGVHETLISLAAILAPIIIVGIGVAKSTVFLVAAATIMVAILPLFIAATLPVAKQATSITLNDALPKLHLTQALKQAIAYLMGFGAIIAGLGGWMEGSILAFLPVYCVDIGLTSSDVAWLLTILGVGAMTCQFAIGWLADNKGVLWTASLCALAAFLAIMVAIVFGKDFVSLAITMFILGGVGGGLLTLGIFWATLDNNSDSLNNRVRHVSIIYTILSAAGPFIAGFVVSSTSSASLFWQQLVVILVIVLVLSRQT